MSMQIPQSGKSIHKGNKGRQALVGNLRHVGLWIEVRAVLLVMAASANSFVHNASCRSFARTLPVHLSSCRVLKFHMAINALNPTLLGLCHHSPHSELKGVTSQATFIHPLPFNQRLNSVGVTSVKPLLILRLMAFAAKLWRQVSPFGGDLHQLIHLSLQLLLPLLVVFVHDFLDLTVVVATSELNH